MNSMCPASKGMSVNWMKIMQEMLWLIACKSLLHVKYLWIWGNIHSLHKLLLHLWGNNRCVMCNFCAMCAIKTNLGTFTKLAKKKKRIWFWFLKLRSSLLALCLFLSAFQAQVSSGKSIMVVKWALSKHPSGGTTPLPGLARAWGWISAPSLIKTHKFWRMGVYALHDNRCYLDNTVWLYMCAHVNSTS